jgi:two-component system sensor histidine kinase PilS (NtrC family)
MPGPASIGTPSGARAGESGDRWEGLRTLVRVRLLIAALALPAGVLFRPDPPPDAWRVLAAALGAVAGLSVLFGLGVRLRRGWTAQVYAHVAADLAMVTALSLLTGGRESQFVMFYALVAITGGLLARVPGGLFASAGACAAILAMPWLGALAGSPVAAAPGATLLFPFLGVVGVLAGVLGDRVQRTRDDLEQTARELDRVRLDNDAILRHLTSGVLTVDADGRVAYLNPAAETMLGVRALDLRGRALDDALPPRLAPLRELVAESGAAGRARARAELEVWHAGGQVLPLGISTSLLGGAGGLTGVVAVFQDLTEVREMERRARRNQTLAEVGALAAGVAHELRNGLKPISGSVEFLQRELAPEGESAVLMDLITRECNRLNRFVTDLLSYSRERDLALEPVVLAEVLGEVCSTASHDPRRRPGVEVWLEPGPADAAVRVDREQMRQVWLNLAANALEAMPDSGALRVRWRDAGGEHVAVEFEDDGPGIAAEDLPRVGEPFYTTKEGGTGLGVAIALRIVERHGGTLGFESVPGRGTVARVTLPGVAPVEAGLAQAA